MNAGPSVRQICKSSFPLTSGERLLLQLQWIHFLPLCSGKLWLNDNHQGNLCVHLRGAACELRFIDAGIWYLPPWNVSVDNHRFDLGSNDESAHDACSFLMSIMKFYTGWWWCTSKDTGMKIKTELIQMLWQPEAAKASCRRGNRFQGPGCMQYDPDSLTFAWNHLLQTHGLRWWKGAHHVAGNAVEEAERNAVTGADLDSPCISAANQNAMSKLHILGYTCIYWVILCWY